MKTYAWEKIGFCANCKTAGKYIELHPANPCPQCGEVVWERVGRWHEESKWY